MSVTPTSPPASLLEFVLHNTRVRRNHCTLQRREQGYELEKRTVQDYNLIFSTRGQPVWVIGDEHIVLKPGMFVLVPPGVLHWGYSKTRRVTLLSLHFIPTLPGGQDVFELLSPPRVQSVKRHSRLDQYLRGALAEFDRPRDADAHRMLASWCRLVVLELLEDNARRGVLQHRSIDPLVTELLDELDSRLSRSTTLPELAGWSGFTPQHLNRVFSRVLGVTPLQYLTRRRLEHAANLLREGRLTVRAIAGKIGFDDPYYFSRMFKQHFGVSPAQYREAAESSDSPS